LPTVNRSHVTEIFMNDTVDNLKRDLLFIFFVRRRMITWTFLTVFACTTLIALFWPPSYMAYGSFLVKGTGKGGAGLMALGSLSTSKEDLYSEIAILTSNNVIENALDRINKDNPQLVARLGRDKQERTYALLDKLKADVAPVSKIITVRLKDGNPKVAHTLLQVIMEEYLRHRVTIFNPVQMTDFLNEQLARYRSELAQKTEEIAGFIQKAGIISIPKQIDNNLTLSRDYQSRILEISEKIAQKTIALELLQSRIEQNDSTAFYLIDTPEMRQETIRLGVLQEKRQLSLQSYKKTSPPVRRIERQLEKKREKLEELASNYLETMDDEVSAFLDQIDHLTDKIRQMMLENIQLRQDQFVYQQMEASLNLLQSSVEVFYKKSEEARINNNLENSWAGSHVSILSIATASKKPEFPKHKKMIPFGFIVAFILSIGVGFLAEYTDQTFKRPEDVEKELQLPVIFSLAEVSEKSNNTVGKKAGPRKKGILVVLLFGLLVLFLLIQQWQSHSSQLLDEQTLSGAGAMSCNQLLSSNKQGDFTQESDVSSHLLYLAMCTAD
jgi:uncharacterized protein involved in exopolysaccharide biosynthesis